MVSTADRSCSRSGSRYRLITLFFVIVVRPFIQWVTENTVESVEDFLPRTIEELEKIQADQKLPGLEEALPQIEEKLNEMN